MIAKLLQQLRKSQDWIIRTAVKITNSYTLRTVISVLNNASGKSEHEPQSIIETLLSRSRTAVANDLNWLMGLCHLMKHLVKGSTLKDLVHGMYNLPGNIILVLMLSRPFMIFQIFVISVLIEIEGLYNRRLEILNDFRLNWQHCKSICCQVANSEIVNSLKESTKELIALLVWVIKDLLSAAKEWLIHAPQNDLDSLKNMYFRWSGYACWAYAVGKPVVLRTLNSLKKSTSKFTALFIWVIKDLLSAAKEWLIHAPQNDLDSLKNMYFRWSGYACWAYAVGKPVVLRTLNSLKKSTNKFTALSIWVIKDLLSAAKEWLIHAPQNDLDSLKNMYTTCCRYVRLIHDLVSSGDARRCLTQWRQAGIKVLKTSSTPLVDGLTKLARTPVVRPIVEDLNKLLTVLTYVITGMAHVFTHWHDIKGLTPIDVFNYAKTSAMDSWQHFWKNPKQRLVDALIIRSYVSPTIVNFSPRNCAIRALLLVSRLGCWLQAQLIYIIKKLTIVVWSLGTAAAQSKVGWSRLRGAALRTLINTDERRRNLKISDRLKIFLARTTTMLFSCRSNVSGVVTSVRYQLRAVLGTAVSSVMNDLAWLRNTYLTAKNAVYDNWDPFSKNPTDFILTYIRGLARRELFLVYVQYVRISAIVLIDDIRAGLTLPIERLMFALRKAEVVLLWARSKIKLLSSLVCASSAIMLVKGSTHLGVNWHVGVCTYVFVSVLAALLLLQQQNQSYFDKVKLLGLQLLLMGWVFVKAKAEQYLPIYLLVEFGTLIFLFALYKNVTYSSKAQQPPLKALLLLMVPILVLIVSEKNVYWVDVYQTYLEVVAIKGDFDALKVLLVITSGQVIVPMFAFIFATTITIILINLRATGKPRGDVKSTNAFDESGAKKSEPYVFKFKK